MSRNWKCIKCKLYFLKCVTFGYNGTHICFSTTIICAFSHNYELTILLYLEFIWYKSIVCYLYDYGITPASPDYECGSYIYSSHINLLLYKSTISFVVRYVYVKLQSLKLTVNDKYHSRYDGCHAKVSMVTNLWTYWYAHIKTWDY